MPSLLKIKVHARLSTAAKHRNAASSRNHSRSRFEPEKKA
jgi:hypothetical protein